MKPVVIERVLPNQEESIYRFTYSSIDRGIVVHVQEINRGSDNEVRKMDFLLPYLTQEVGSWFHINMENQQVTKTAATADNKVLNEIYKNAIVEGELLYAEED